jgi:hypothetical protein
MADQDYKIPDGFCQCGCGEKTNIVRRNIKKLGYKMGDHRRYISGHNIMHNGVNGHYKWGNGICRGVNRYTEIRLHEHPRAKPNGYINEHIWLAEKALGRALPKGTEVHHVNGSKDGGPLVICQDRAYHSLLHRRTRALKACGHANWRKCWFCGQWDAPENLYIRPNRSEGFHRKCHKEYERDRLANHA